MKKKQCNCDQLPKINGEIDSEVVADIIVTHILSEVAKIYGNRIDNETMNRLVEYTRNKIELVKKETNKNKADI